MVNNLPSIFEEETINICWLRRDLRLEDNAALFHALEAPESVLLLFIFDTWILDTLSDEEDKRVTFIHQHLRELNSRAGKFGSGLVVMHGKPEDAFDFLLQKYRVRNVYANRDYEPYARKRDGKISLLLRERGKELLTFKDQVIFERSDILKPDSTPYTVFTPYSRKWKEALSQESVKPYSSAGRLDKLVKIPFQEIPALEMIGFKEILLEIPEMTISEEVIRNYDKFRNFPAVEGTSRMSVHLRFGTVSIRKLVALAPELNETWLNELIWREFFMMILYHFPTVETENFRKKYDRVQWRNNEEEFELWCRGETGYAMVDAGMRQLNATGFMHNRVRMIVAGFLTKHLLIDWRWGEAYFASKLLDYELAANNGNWQWAAGTGCDSAPYFRIFNPVTQLKKFDPELEYVKRWIPNFRNDHLPPIVDHAFARERALRTYRRGLQS